MINLKRFHAGTCWACPDEKKFFQFKEKPFRYSGIRDTHVGTKKPAIRYIKIDNGMFFRVVTQGMTVDHSSHVEKISKAQFKMLWDLAKDLY